MPGYLQEEPYRVIACRPGGTVLANRFCQLRWRDRLKVPLEQFRVALSNSGAKNLLFDSRTLRHVNQLLQRRLYPVLLVDQAEESKRAEQRRLVSTRLRQPHRAIDFSGRP